MNSINFKYWHVTFEKPYKRPENLRVFYSPSLHFPPSYSKTGRHLVHVLCQLKIVVFEWHVSLFFENSQNEVELRKWVNPTSKILETHQQFSTLHLCSKRREGYRMCCFEKGNQDIRKLRSVQKLNLILKYAVSKTIWEGWYVVSLQETLDNASPLLLRINKIAISRWYGCLAVRRSRKFIDSSLWSWTSFFRHPLKITRSSKDQRWRHLGFVHLWKHTRKNGMFCSASLPKFRRHRVYVPSRARVEFIKAIWYTFKGYNASFCSRLPPLKSSLIEIWFSKVRQTIQCHLCSTKELRRLACVLSRLSFKIQSSYALRAFLRAVCLPGF
jgi:hypothetical protein